ncbi:MAG: tyrosine-type recombinase/integrase [Flavipsychrobacter sp.]|nr:tyrosine-type recombinase/integrase [Flavipsychrobacter sp.]
MKHYLRDISQWKIKTIKRKVATLMAMFNYLEYEDLLTTNPIRRIRISLKEASVLPKALTKLEIKAILDEAYKAIFKAHKTTFSYLEDIRNATVIELLFSAGAVYLVSKNAKVIKNVTPHTFRYSFATLLLENDVDIKYIQSMLGHSSIVTTQIYTQVNKEKQKQILADKHPRMDLSM